MGKCVNHPDRETSYMCMKHGIYLCEDCLKCRDPEIYCKFRSSCPIWFMEKRKKRAIVEEKQKITEETVKHTVVFRPDEKEIRVPDGTILLEAARLADVHLNSSCNGKGACGKCKLVIESGNVESHPSPLLTEKEKKNKYVLACLSSVKGDITVKIPEKAKIQ